MTVDGPWAGWNWEKSKKRKNPIVAGKKQPSMNAGRREPGLFQRAQNQREQAAQRAVE
jgi:hypothetical protein